MLANQSWSERSGQHNPYSWSERSGQHNPYTLLVPDLRLLRPSGAFPAQSRE